MADGSMTDLILDRIRFRSTEIGAESESVARSVRSLTIITTTTMPSTIMTMAVVATSAAVSLLSPIVTAG